MAECQTTSLLNDPAHREQARSYRLFTSPGEPRDNLIDHRPDPGRMPQAVSYTHLTLPTKA